MGRSAILFVNLRKKNTEEAASAIKEELEKRQMDVTVFSFKEKLEDPPKGKWDIAFSLGGDGTVLYAARCLAPLKVPIMSINLGHLGFIAGVNKENWLDVFNLWEKDEIFLSRRCMFDVFVERESKNAYKNICLNEVVVSAAGKANLINLDVSIKSGIGRKSNAQSAGDEQKNFKRRRISDGQFPAGTMLGSYRCDGLIVSTPTGSTAYSLAAGGPILDPDMEAMILNPICPFSLSNRPFVLPSRQTIAITVAEEHRSQVLLTVDGQDSFPLKGADKIFVQQSAHNTYLVCIDRHMYYSALRTKLFHTGKKGEADA